MRYHLFQKFCGKMVKIKETSFLSTRGAVCFALNCTFDQIPLKMAVLYDKYFSKIGVVLINSLDHFTIRVCFAFVKVQHIFLYGI